MVKNLFLIGIVPLLIVALFSSLSSRLITNSLINQKVKTEASNGIQKL
ncbi:hypothetical protein [uncultured Treponema sp.]|nr:hypothetical protein [uncultured Treponema sp.]